MHCYIQVLTLTFANFGFSGGRYQVREKAVNGVKVQGELREWQMNEWQ